MIGHRRVPVVTTLIRPVEARHRLRLYLGIMALALLGLVTSPLLPTPVAVVTVVIASLLPPLAVIVANQPRSRVPPSDPVRAGRAVTPREPEHQVIDPD